MKFNLVGYSAFLALGLLAWACPISSQAGWGMLHGGGSSGGGSSGFASSGGSSGGYTASYVSSGYASYGSSGSSGGPGLLHRIASRIHGHFEAKHARHAARRAAYGSSGYASYGSSGGSSGYVTYSSSGGGGSSGYSTSYRHSGGSSGGTSVSYGSTGYSSGVSYGSTGTSYDGDGSVYYGPATNSAAPTASMVSNIETKSDAVYLMVAVPSDAKIFVNDNPTTSTGAVRKFVSRGLAAGKEYRFQVRAEMTSADGKLMTEEKTLVVSAGQQEQVQFAFTESESPIETAVTLNLPAGAKVILAGNETNATGESRTFRTRRLKAGQFWDDYKIEVEYEGQVKSQSVRLIGGDSLQLTFDFNTASADSLAAR